MILDKQVQNDSSRQLALPYENEINLSDVVFTIFRHKKIVLSIVAVFVCVALIYVFTVKRVYQVESILLPPEFEQIQPLTALNALKVSDVRKIDADVVFSMFLRNIESRALRKEFFNKFNVLKSFSDGVEGDLSDKDVNDIFEGFSSNLNVVKSKKATGLVYLTLDGENKDKIGVWLDDFVELVNKKTVEQLRNNLKAEVQLEIRNIKVEIKSKKEIYKRRRQDKLSILQENYLIAEKLGIVEHLFVPRVSNKPKEIIQKELENISKRLSNTDNLSEYMKGTKILEAEIKTLSNPISEFHIHGLRDLQEKLRKFEQSLNIDEVKLAAVVIDKRGVEKVEPIFPKRKLVVLLSLIIGGMFGVFSVFFLEFLSKIQSRINDSSSIDSAKLEGN